MHQALTKLVEEEFLARFEVKTKYHEKVVFFFNKKLDTPAHKPLMSKHIKSICKLIDKYSTPAICKALGSQLEGLVKAELRAQGFKIVGVHTKNYRNKEWTETDHDLDFIAEHRSGRLNVGVEVKNTLPIIRGKN